MLNVITLVGCLTRDPESRTTNNGTAVGAFRIACDDGRKDPATGKDKAPLYMDCTVFGPQAKFLIDYFHKGSYIGLYGRLTSREYTNSQGFKVTAYSIICDRLEFVGSGGGNKAGANPEMPTPADNGGGIAPQVSPVSDSQNLGAFDFDSDDVPF
ncbi:MAG: single-stranded DNA-binding protein [Bacilli bacterium]|nr:single-stranded DNA-binding protein [Bacilli bacterium]